MEDLFEKYRRFSEDYLRQNGYVVNGVICRTYADEELKAFVNNKYVFNIPMFKDIEDLKEQLDGSIKIDKKIKEEQNSIK